MSPADWKALKVLMHDVDSLDGLARLVSALELQASIEWSVGRCETALLLREAHARWWPLYERVVDRLYPGIVEIVDGPVVDVSVVAARLSDEVEAFLREITDGDTPGVYDGG